MAGASKEDALQIALQELWNREYTINTFLDAQCDPQRNSHHRGRTSVTVKAEKDGVYSLEDDEHQIGGVTFMQPPQVGAVIVLLEWSFENPEGSGLIVYQWDEAPTRPNTPVQNYKLRFI